MLTKSDETSGRTGHVPPPHHRQLTRQESTLSRGFKVIILNYTFLSLISGCQLKAYHFKKSQEKNLKKT